MNKTTNVSIEKQMNDKKTVEHNKTKVAIELERLYFNGYLY